MYYKYSYLTTATAANIRTDLSALLCGETNMANLSAGCDQVNTTLLAGTVETNWTLFDAAASATSFVLRSLNLDGTTFKYMQVNVTAVALPVISMIGWELWNATTKVGTNQSASNSALVSNTVANVSFSAPTQIFIITTARLAMLADSPSRSNASGFLFEFSRDTPMTNTTYPCHGVSGSDGALFGFGGITTGSVTRNGLCRIKSPIAAGDLVGTAIAFIFNNAISLNSYSQGGSQSTFNQAADGAISLVSFPILLTAGANNGSTNFFIIGTLLGGILVLPPNLPSFSHLDEITVDGTVHVMLKNIASGAILIPRA